MEATGPGTSIAGLAEVFNACVEIMERIDPYNDFGIDSRAVISQFDKDKLVFRKWGEAVSLQGKSPRAYHHKGLDDPAVVSEVQGILISIHEMARVSGEISSAQQGSSFTTSKGRTTTPRRLPFEKAQGEASRKTQLGWTWRQKLRFITLSQQFGCLLESLCILAPPESMDDVVRPIRRTHTGPDLPMGISSRPRDRQIERKSSQPSP